MVLCAVPLVNVLGYESAEVACILVTFASAHIALRHLNSGTVSLGREPLDQLYVRLCWRAALPLWPPLVLLLLNALRVRNCDLGVGLSLYGLLPVASVAVVVAWVLLIAALVQGPRRRGWVYAGVILASIAMNLHHLATQPPIWSFHPTIGYFAGSIYDEALAIPDGLLAFRAYCLATVGVILCGLSIGMRRRRKHPLAAQVAGLTLCLIVAGVVYAQRFELRIESTRADIVEALGGVAKSEHFVIYYSLEDSSVANHIDDIVADHEYRWDQLERYFGVAPNAPVYSFIYPDRATKGRFMGAARTLIAKPWLGEIHITYTGVGDGKLTHELAHLFSEPFGSGPLALAGSGLSIDMGLIEGAATAAAWDGDQLTYHGWAAALYALDLAPEIESVLGASGFWTSYGRTVYTLMGSFCRWLVEERGADLFRQVYGSGDFEAVYGQPVGDLVAAWKGFLESIPLDEHHLAIATYRYDRPSIFGKPCARSIAERADEAERLASARRFDDAVACLEGVVADDPDNLRYQLHLARAQQYLGDLDAARLTASQLIEREGAGAVTIAQAGEVLGDIAWAGGQRDAAVAHYRQVLGQTASEGAQRRVWAKMTGAADAGLSEVVFDLLIARPGPSRDTLTLTMAEVADATGSGLMNYLMGVRLYNSGDWAGARRYLDLSALALASEGHEASQSLDAVQRRGQLMLGKAAFFQGGIGFAQQTFRDLASQGDPRRDAFVREAMDWDDRCDWALEQALERATNRR